MKISNYIRYGTNNEKEIMLFRYGFIFEDFEWLMPIVEYVIFKDTSNLDQEQFDKIKKFL